MKPLLATIDSIYNLYSSKSYSKIEDDIIYSSILLTMKEHGIKQEHIRELKMDKLLKVSQCKAYSLLECNELKEFWQNGTTLLRIYEYISGRKDDKKEQFGIFYTPEWIVKYMVNNSMQEFLLNHDFETIKILEPACGCGAFLLCLFDILFDLYSEKTKYSSVHICKYIIENNLYGIDVDSKAIEICKYLLMLKVFKRTGKLILFNFNLWIEDFLKTTSIERNFFDLIIGNPPYLENRRLNKYCDKEYLKENFITAVGRFDIYSLFVENSVLFLKEGGILHFILPGNLLSNNNFSQTRKYILDNSMITSIINLGEGIFEDVGMNLIIISMCKSTVEINDLILCKNISNSENKKRDIELVPYNKIPQRFYRNTLLNVFDIDSSNDTFKLREKIYNNSSLKVKDVADVVAGIATGNIRKKLLTRNNGKLYVKKVLEGKNIQRFYHEWSGLYFIDDKNLIDKQNGEYATFMRNDMIHGEKLIIRQTADKFICSYDNEGYYILNTLYSLIIRDGYENLLDIKYLLALLNSKLFHFLYSTLIREKGKLFPQIKIFHIQHSPIRIPNESIQQEMRKVVDEIIFLNKKINDNNRLDKTNMPEYKKRKETLSGLLDDMIFGVFELTAREIEVINNEIK